MNYVYFFKIFNHVVTCWQDTITYEDLDDIENVISKIGKDNKLAIEKEEIRDLKAEISDYVEDVQELEAVSEKARKTKVVITKTTNLLIFHCVCFRFLFEVLNLK